MGKSYFKFITLPAMLNDPPVTRFDFNDKLDGTSFTQTKDWKPIAPEWNKYAWEQFGELSFTPPPSNGTQFSTYIRRSYQQPTPSSLRMRMKKGRAVEIKGERRMNIPWIWISMVFLSYRQ